MPSADPNRTREVADSSRTSHSEKLETFPEMPQNAPLIFHHKFRNSKVIALKFNKIPYFVFGPNKNCSKC